MPRPAIEGFWREQIRVVSANNPKAGPGRIHLLLSKIGAAVGRNDWPSERTIGREIQRFRASEASARGDYREFRWPDSMEPSGLPWEASSAVMDALRYVHNETQRSEWGSLLHHSVNQVGRPLVSRMRWFWRVTLARPDVDVETRWIWASVIDNVKSGIIDGDLEAVEREMATGPFSEDQDDVDDQPWFGRVPSPPKGQNFGGELEMLEALSGWRFSRREGHLTPEEEEEERKAWERNAQTAKEQFIKGLMADGLPRSPSRKANAGTTRTKSGKKSRGS